MDDRQLGKKIQRLFRGGEEKNCKTFAMITIDFLFPQEMSLERKASLKCHVVSLVMTTKQDCCLLLLNNDECVRNTRKCPVDICRETIAFE